MANPRAALALIDERYLLYREAEKVYALDLRAAWAAVLAARLAQAGAQSRAARPLLIPERIAPSSELWRHCTPQTLARHGFEIDDLGPAGYLVRAVPMVLPELPWAAFLARLARAASGDDVQVAHAAAATVVLGSHGQPARRMLEALQHGAAACGLSLTRLALAVDGRLFAPRGGRHE